MGSSRVTWSAGFIPFLVSDPKTLWNLYLSSFYWRRAGKCILSCFHQTDLILIEDNMLSSQEGNILDNGKNTFLFEIPETRDKFRNSAKINRMYHANIKTFVGLF